MTTPNQLRNQQRDLVRLATNDMAALWRQVSNAREARIALRDVLPALIRTYGQAAASVAADWYDEARAAASVGGAFRSIPASVTGAGSDSLALWAAEHGTDLDSIRSLAEGGLQRRVVNFGRETVMGSALADPRADGWQRVGVGSCDFCNMLIGRGAVYSEASADFGSHDNCKCAAAPAFSGRPREVRPYKASVRGSEADQDRAKAWIENNL